MDTLNSDLFQVLRNVLTQLPSLFTLLICLVFAITRWRRHPRVSLIAALGSTFLILHELFFSAAYIWLPRLFLASASLADNGGFFKVLRLTSSFLFAAALGTLLIAVFINRKQRIS